MRIASLLPSATEILLALGLEDEIVGVSPDCDYPSAARTKPVVSRDLIDPGAMAQCDIDAGVVAHLGDGSSYLSRLGPRLVDGAELLAHILHPEQFPKPWSKDAVPRLAV